MTEYRNKNVKKITSVALFTALALALSLIDSYISLFIPFLPGIKLGLSNIIILYALYKLDIKMCVFIIAAKCVLTGVLSGAVTMTAFSLAGGFLSLLIMAVLKNRLSIIKVSVMGGIFHNLGQIITAVVLTATPMAAYYFPVLLLTGSISGFCTGIIAKILLMRIGNKKIIL